MLIRLFEHRYDKDKTNTLEHEAALLFLEDVLTTIQPIQADEGMVPRPTTGFESADSSCPGCDRPHCVRTGAQKLLEVRQKQMKVLPTLY